MKAIAITSGKGGAGKSVVTANLGLALAKLGRRVLLFDADVSLANLDLLLGLSCEFNLIDVLEGTKEVEEIIIEGPFGLKLLPASSGVLRLERLEEPQLIRLALGLQRMAEGFDTLLIDTGAGLTKNVLFFCSSADDLLVVTTPDPTALTDAYALIKILSTQYQLSSAVVLVNQANTAAEAAAVFARLDKVCQQHLPLKLVDAGYLLRDRQLEQAVRERRPLVVSQPEAGASRQFTALARRYDALFGTTGKGVTQDFWGRLLGHTVGEDKPDLAERRGAQRPSD
jgi:flagellar biosynthesis protein FlhG